MKGISDDVEGLEFGVGNGDASRIRLAVLDGSDVQSFLGGRMRDQLNDGFQGDERFGTPVDGNERKEPVFDLVPFAGGRRIMRHGDAELFFIGQGLQGLLPQLVAYAIAASPISGDQEFGCLRIQPFAAAFPPPPDTLHRELRRFVVDAHIHKALVVQKAHRRRRGWLCRQLTSGSRTHSPGSRVLWAAIRAPGS
jgi:hypothetical protein